MYWLLLSSLRCSKDMVESTMHVFVVAAFGAVLQAAC